MKYSLLFIFFCLAGWLCLKMCSENRVLVRLQQIGAKDFTVHCESGKGLRLQGEAVSQTHSFKDAEPQPVIPTNANKKMQIKKGA